MMDSFKRPLEDLSEEELIELRRKRRLEILEKYKDQEVEPMKTVHSSNNNTSTIKNNHGSMDDRTTVEHSKTQSLGLSVKDQDEEDMFSENFQQKIISGDVKQLQDGRGMMSEAWDDSHGYYIASPGEKINGSRYEVKTELGRGVFGSVLRAHDIQSGYDVAIKVIRKNMHVSGLKELALLQKTHQEDPGGRKHIIRLLDHFEHRKHLCLAVELLSINLRDLLKKFGKNVGLNIKAVQVYSNQLFHALSLLYQCKIIHADIKPDNILVSENKLVIKLCDLGTAFNLTDLKEDERSSYIVSRYYRAPEIILGLPYDYGIDMWSSGCTLYELFTGKMMFPGRDNSEMLKLMMEYKGKFSHKMLRKGKETTKYFDETDNYTFLHKTRDSIGGGERDMVIKLNITQSVKDIKQSLLSSVGSMQNQNELAMTVQFADLLEKIFVLNPEKRITWKEALKHPFVKGMQ